MFEVDWADYDCERVGQRRARKEVERELKKKEDASSHHETISTRTSCSSDQHRRTFFGSIGRKKKQEPSTPESTTADGYLKRGSFRIPRPVTGIASSLTEDSTEHRSQGALPIQPRAGSNSAANKTKRTLPETPDRSSNESMLSRMTDLTIPTLESHRNSDGSIMDATRAATQTVQGLREEGPPAARISKTTRQLDMDQALPRLRVGANITTRPEIPRTPTSPPLSYTPSSPDNGRSASEFIDDWFTAVHGPIRQLPRSGPHGTTRRGNVLLPPNLRRPVPMTPTRRSAKKDVFIAPRASPIQFLANDPDDWKTPDEWNHALCTETHPADDGVAEQDDEAAVDPTIDAMDSAHVEERDVTESRNSQENNQLLESPTKKPELAASVCCQFQWKVTPGTRGRPGPTTT